MCSLEPRPDVAANACIDAAKAIVECACRVIVENLDDPASPHKPQEENPEFGRWVTAAVRTLELSGVRDSAFQKLISQHHKLTTTLGDLRNRVGTLSHGKDGFIAKLSMHHRRASLLAADAIVTFLHEAYLEREPDPVLTLEPYERFKQSNALIDSLAEVRSEFGSDGFLYVTVLLPGGEELPLTIEPSRLLYGVDREAYKEALSICREAVPAVALKPDPEEAVL